MRYQVLLRCLFQDLSTVKDILDSTASVLSSYSCHLQIKTRKGNLAPGAAYDRLLLWEEPALKIQGQIHSSVSHPCHPGSRGSTLVYNAPGGATSPKSSSSQDNQVFTPTLYAVCFLHAGEGLITKSRFKCPRLSACHHQNAAK